MMPDWIGIFGCTPLSIWLSARYPRTGAAWGLVAMASLSFVHFAYIWWYFRHDEELAAGPS